MTLHSCYHLLPVIYRIFDNLNIYIVKFFIFTSYKARILLVNYF